jgi:hypothetical protein
VVVPGGGGGVCVYNNGGGDGEGASISWRCRVVVSLWRAGVLN